VIYFLLSRAFPRLARLFFLAQYLGGKGYTFGVNLGPPLRRGILGANRPFFSQGGSPLPRFLQNNRGGSFLLRKFFAGQTFGA